MPIKSLPSPPRTVQIPSQGTSIALTIWENAPEAVTVLFYPGTMASPFMYLILLEELHRLGCNVVAIHPVGHGLSLSSKKCFTFEDILHNGKTAQNFAQHYFRGPIVVCGHSQGGILSLAHALDDSQIAAIFPITTLLPQREDAIHITRLSPLWKKKDLFLKVMRTASRVMPFFPIPFLAYLQLSRVCQNGYKIYAPTRASRISYPLCFISSLFHQDFSKAEQEGHISCPVILLTAKDDVLFPLATMESSLDAIKAPMKKLIVLEKGGHLCAMSRVYAKHIAAHVAAHCAVLGLPLHSYK